jgi:hypothetical protein
MSQFAGFHLKTHTMKPTTQCTSHLRSRNDGDVCGIATSGGEQRNEGIGNGLWAQMIATQLAYVEN